MKLSLNWLKDFVSIEETPEKLAERLTLAGIEVEKIEYLGKGLDGVIVGEIKTIIKHPAADKLHVTKVDVGKGKILDIICGASNIKVGQKVPTALVGTTLPSGLKIEKRPIRGVESVGMLCAEDELGLGEDHTGIVILDKDAKVGQKFTTAYKLDDTVFDLALTPQRADLFSVQGIAREVAALTGLKLEPRKEVSSTQKTQAAVSVRIVDKTLCPQYSAQVIENIRKTKTPQWMETRLIASGVRPISLIVDVTNYVMLETGQPLHAFDFDKLSGGKKRASLIIRKAKKGERITTLDGKDRELAPSMLVIANEKNPVAIAGVMGGKNTEVNASTSKIVLESAIFHPSSVRKTSQALGLRSEASLRFEKGIAWDMPIVASHRVAELLRTVTQSTGKGLVVQSSREPKQSSISMTVDAASKLIGVDIPFSEGKKSLEKLGFSVTEKRSMMSVQPPLWRHDIHFAADVIEEIGRMHGLDKLPATLFTSSTKPAPSNKLDDWAEFSRDLLVGFGFTETLSYSYYGENEIKSFGLKPEDHYQVTNALNPDQRYMKLSLLPQLLQATAKNFHTRDHVSLFEIGNIFEHSTKQLPDEKYLISAVSAGKTSTFYHLKGALTEFLGALGINQYRLSFTQKVTPYAEVSAEIHIDKSVQVGTIAEFNEKTLNYFKLRGQAAAFELSLPVLLRLLSHKRKFTSLPHFPVITRDISVVVDHSVAYQEIKQIVLGAHTLIAHIEGFDLYPLKGQKSIALHIVFQSTDRTLTTKEIDVIMERIDGNLERQLSAKIRKGGGK